MRQNDEHPFQKSEYVIKFKRRRTFFSEVIENHTQRGSYGFKLCCCYGFKLFCCYNMVRTVEYILIAVLLKVTLFCQLIKKKVRRILFADYAVRHRLQAVKERKKLWGTLAAARYDVSVRSVYGHQS